MTCPRCGADTNHQADMPVHAVKQEEAARMTVALDGVIEDVFACPNCGRIE
jgi:ribosomal protein S27AE